MLLLCASSGLWGVFGFSRLVGGCKLRKLYLIDYKLLFTGYKLYFTDYKLYFTDCKLYLDDCKLYPGGGGIAR